MHFHFSHRAPALNHLPSVISEIVVPCAHLDPLANGNLGPPDVADEDWSYTATHFRLYGVRRELSLLSCNYISCFEGARQTVVGSRINLSIKLP
jgi:hypothetical protein